MIDSKKDLNILSKNKRIIDSRNKNINLEILRMILCFWVVTCHTCTFKNTKINRIISSHFHVPSFMIISFFYFYKNLDMRNIPKIKKRFERLLLPYFIWPISLYILNNILLILHCESFFNKKLSIYDLILSFIFGRHINLIFWFQFDLIFVSLIFSIISFIFKNNFLIILNLLLILSYFLQYSRINYDYFDKYKDLNHRNIGSIVEMIPFNVTGILLSYFNIIKKTQNKKLYSISICIIILIFLLKFKIFKNIPGFRYPGLNLNIGGISLFILFSLIPFEEILIPHIFNFILLITSYTGGIYYLHCIFFHYFKKKFFFIRKKTFKGTFIIYLLNYIFCLIGYKIFHKTKYKNLFI